MKVQNFKHRVFTLSLCLSLSACVTDNGMSKANLDNKIITAANANIQLGMNYLTTNQPQMAQQKLLAAIRIAPDYAPSWYTMAYYLEVTGQLAQANNDYLIAIRLAPKSGDSLNNYGTFLCHTGKAKASLLYFIKAAQDPDYLDSAGAFENAGLCAELIPDNTLAIKYFKVALQRDPNLVRSEVQLRKLTG